LSREGLLDSLLRRDARLRQVEDGIFSVVPDHGERNGYDSAALFYDLLIGNPVYNRMVWGNWPKAYADYCRAALNSSTQGCVLDAGCGTLVFTAPEYLLHATRPIVLLDRSLGMLKRARGRLTSRRNALPEHIVLLQGDITDLPFKAESFETVLSWGVLHLFEDFRLPLRELSRIASPGSLMFFTSLVTGRQPGTRYLKWLNRHGEVAAPRTINETLSHIRFAGLHPKGEVRGNMAYLLSGKPDQTAKLDTCRE
jgi:ubiquinone/menaquinone biosynthesis C-methylase UbiE